ncbi:MAG: hypothetical protein Q8K59_08555, partial [Nitrosomonas sp.]|nr:hypothetical protein [Nitrosomonas sp.]MDP1951125.1 hypothetical protein [Nitrosomonas sp.]
MTGKDLCLNDVANLLRAPLKIQFCEQPLCGLPAYPISSQYGVAHKKFSLTYQPYAALKFFSR